MMELNWGRLFVDILVTLTRHSRSMRQFFFLAAHLWANKVPGTTRGFSATTLHSVAELFAEH